MTISNIERGKLSVFSGELLSSQKLKEIREYNPLPWGENMVDWKKFFMIRGISMNLPQGKHIKWNYLALAFAIPCVGMLFVMLISQPTSIEDIEALYNKAYE